MEVKKINKCEKTEKNKSIKLIIIRNVKNDIKKCGNEIKMNIQH